MIEIDYLLVANLLSGRGKAKEELEKVQKFLSKNNKTFMVIALEIVAPISNWPFPEDIKVKTGVISIGGDGTISETIGLMIRRKIEAPLFIIPCGTANFFGKNLGVGKEVDLGRISRGRIISCDLGVAEYSGKKDFFLIGLGMGFAANFVASTEGVLKRVFGHLGYLVAAAMELLRIRIRRYEIEIDGKKLSIDSSMVMILNFSPKINRFLPLFSFPRIKKNDGKIDLIYANGKSSLSSFLGVLFFHLFGRVNFNLISHLRGEKIKVFTQEEDLVQIDGEIKGKFPLVVSVLRERINFLV